MLTGTNEFGALKDQMGLDKITLNQVTSSPFAWRLLPEGERLNFFLFKHQKTKTKTKKPRRAI